MPGSQVEVNDIKNSFERGESDATAVLLLRRSPVFVTPMVDSDCSSGEDPLIDDQNEHDINSVAGVLKLYFRGLENPLFPKECFLDFISTISESQAAQIIQKRHGQNTPCTLLSIPLLLTWKHMQEQHLEAIRGSLRPFTSKWGCVTLLRSFNTELFPCCFYSNGLITSSASQVWGDTERGGVPCQTAPHYMFWCFLFSSRRVLVNLSSQPAALCVSELESGAERAHHIQQIVATLPHTVIIVMRYLFAFLNQ